VGGHVPGEGNGEIEAQSHVPSAVVGEPVGLLVGVSAAFGEEYFGVFEHGRIDGDIAVGGKMIFQGSNQLPPGNLRGGEKIPETFENSGLNNAGHGRAPFRPHHRRMAGLGQ
jgi:hypothetical protein